MSIVFSFCGLISCTAGAWIVYHLQSHRPSRSQLALISALALLVIGVGVHSVNAIPVTGQTWASSTISPGQTDTATITVAISSSCPSGQSFDVLSLTVQDPNGNQWGDGGLAAPCGGSLMMTFPTQFVFGTVQD